MALGLFCIALRSVAAQAEEGYQLGNGYPIGDFNLAGYSNVVADLPSRGDKSLAIESLSVFVSGHVTTYFNPFVETELTRIGVAGSGAPGSNPDNAGLALERIYNDIDLTDALTLRFGKMLAPVGEWNEIHAAPLVLTTLRPAVTYANFANHLTGLSLNYSDRDAGFPDVKIYMQPDGELDERPSSEARAAYQLYDYKAMEGFHVAVPLSLLDQFGISYQHSRNAAATTESLIGVDFKYRYDAWSLQGEATYSILSGNLQNTVRHDETGAYIAPSYALSEEWSLTSWLEEFGPRDAKSMALDALLGVEYRPTAPVVFKLEYLENFGGRPVNPNGLFLSWSVLF